MSTLPCQSHSRADARIDAFAHDSKICAVFERAQGTETTRGKNAQRGAKKEDCLQRNQKSSSAPQECLQVRTASFSPAQALERKVSRDQDGDWIVPLRGCSASSFANHQSILKCVHVYALTCCRDCSGPRIFGAATAAGGGRGAGEGSRNPLIVCESPSEISPGCAAATLHSTELADTAS